MKMGAKEGFFSSIMKDIIEVLGAILAIIILSKIFLGQRMLVPLVVVTSCSMYHPNDILGVGCSSTFDSDSWKEWLLARNISEDKIRTFPFQSGFSKGDMILTITPDGTDTLIKYFPDTQVGDVIIYERDRKHFGGGPIIHRVVGIVHVRNWSVVSVEGTLDCFSEKDFQEKFIPIIKKCQESSIFEKDLCPYFDYPTTPDFEFFITKGDNNPSSDQCSPTPIALPVTNKQLLARGFLRIPYLGWIKLKIIPI